MEGVSYYGTQYTLSVREWPTIAKKEKKLNGVRKLIRTKQKSRAVDADIHHSFSEKFDPFMRAGDGQSCVEV